MKKIVLITLIAAIAVYSCSSGKDEKDSGKTSATQNDNMVITPSESGVVNLDLTNGKGKVNVHKNENQTIYVEFDSEGYSKIYANLYSKDSLVNIRFSQIFLPDGSMDGPFGHDLEYNLPMDGIYKISIHENMMAGDPWGGNFTVEVTLRK